MPKIWYTKGLSNTAEALEMIRTDPLGAGMHLCASHTDPGWSGFWAADTMWMEPVGVEGDAYPQWVLETAVANGVDLVVAQRRPGNFDGWRDRFASAGVVLSLPASSEDLVRLDDKGAFYDDMGRLGVPTCAHAVFDDVASFDAARARLADDPRVRAHGLCIKPVRGIYGSGFRVLSPGDEFARMLNISNLAIDPDAFRSMLGATSSVRPMLLMSMLPGVERSVDFLAHEGVVVAAVARLKRGQTQAVEVDGPSVEMARRLAAVYGLHGVCNLQTKEADGVPHALEINPRMSGGFGMACLSGVKLPLWHVRLALGLSTPADVPLPQAVTSVAQRLVSVVRAA